MEGQTQFRCKTCKVFHVRESFRGLQGTELKNCKPCREKQKTYRETYHRKHPDAAQENQARYNKTAKAKAKSAKHRKTEKSAATRQRHRETERFKQTTDAYRNSDRWKEMRAAEYERTHSDPGRNLEHNIGCKIGKMLNGTRQSSETVMSFTEFEGRDDLMAHIESTFEHGMSFSNFGKHLVNGPIVWNVGHRIARFHFDTSNQEDVRRCWMKQNLFAQWAKENLSAHAKFPDEEELLKLQASWPVAWNNKLPSRSERGRMENAWVVAGSGKLGVSSSSAQN